MVGLKEIFAVACRIKLSIEKSGELMITLFTLTIFISDYIEILSFVIDFLSILRRSLDRTIFLFSFTGNARLIGVSASITIVHI